MPKTDTFRDFDGTHFWKITGSSNIVIPFIHIAVGQKDVDLFAVEHLRNTQMRSALTWVLQVSQSSAYWQKMEVGLT